jgi:hypothetical protein
MAHFQKLVINNNYVCLENPRNMSKLIGFLKHHMKSCQNTDCVCTDIDSEMVEENKFDTSNLITSTFARRGTIFQPKLSRRIKDNFCTILQDSQYHTWNFDERIYLILNIELKIWYRNIKNDCSIALISAYLNFHFMNNKFNALYHLMQAEEGGPSLLTKSLIYILRYTIEYDLFQNENRETDNQKTLFSNLFNYQDIFLKFHQNICISTELYFQFWTEITLSHLSK